MHATSKPAELVAAPQESAPDPYCGTVSLVGLPPGSFPLPIFDTVLNGITVRGSIVGTRLDLQEALDFAGAGKAKATVATEPLENINQIFARMRAGDIDGRIVIDFQK